MTEENLIPPEPETPAKYWDVFENADIVSNNGSQPPEESIIRERFILRDAAYALQPQPPIDWIVENLFSAGSLSLIVGAPGTKKTRSLLSAAVRVAIGGKWITFATRQATVLFLDEESGERRFARWLGEALRGEFGNENTPIKFVSLARLNLFQSDGDDLILQSLIEETGAQLVIIDALADLMPGADENSVKDTHMVFMRLRKICEETQAAIVVIHHANKAGDYRGSSAMSGAVDLLIMVDSKNGSPIIEFETKKARDIEPIRFAAQIHFDQDMTWLSPIAQSQYAKRNPGEEYVIRILKERGEMSLPEIKASADTCSARMARDAVFKLSREGAIYRTNPGETGRGHPAIYAIKEEEPANENGK